MSKFMGEEEGKFWVGYSYDSLCRILPLFGPRRAGSWSPCSPVRTAWVSVGTEDPRPQLGGILNSPFPRCGILRQSQDYGTPSRVSVASWKVGDMFAPKSYSQAHYAALWAQFLHIDGAHMLTRAQRGHIHSARSLM